MGAQMVKEVASKTSDVAGDGAAVEEGIVPGGGVALLRALPALEKLALAGDQRYGVNIIRRALEEPLRQMAHNAGVEGAVVVSKVRAGARSYGYNVATDTYEDLVRAGVIDPTKVVRVALQNAASVASLMLTTQAMIARLSKRESEDASAGIGGAMGGMGM
jgi:chaperonin GroEL